MCSELCADSYFQQSDHAKRPYTITDDSYIFIGQLVLAAQVVIIFKKNLTIKCLVYSFLKTTIIPT